MSRWPDAKTFCFAPAIDKVWTKDKKLPGPANVNCGLHASYKESSRKFFSDGKEAPNLERSSSSKNKDKLLVSSGDFSHPLGLV